MKKYIEAYIKGIDQYILQRRYRDINEIIREHLRKINEDNLRN